MSEKMVCTSDCIYCTNCILKESDKSRVKIHCIAKEREYWYGQMVPCNEMEERKDAD